MESSGTTASGGVVTSGMNSASQPQLSVAREREDHKIVVDALHAYVEKQKAVVDVPYEQVGRAVAMLARYEQAGL